MKTQGHAEGRDPCGGGGEPGAMLPSPWSQLGLPGAGAGKEGSSPTAFRSLAGTFIRTFSLQDCERIDFCCSGPPVCGTLSGQP